MNRQLWFRRRSWHWNHWTWWMKHAPNGREKSKTARDWDPRTNDKTARVGTQGPIHEEKSIANSRRTSTFSDWYRRVHEANQCDQAARRVGADVPGDATRTGWCVSRASDVLEMIQQKSMHRKSETRRSHSLQQSRRRRMRTNVDERLRNSDATRLATAQQCRKDKETCGTGTTQWSWKSHREQRSRRGRVSHRGVGDSSVPRSGRVSKERDRFLCSVLVASFSQNTTVNRRFTIAPRTEWSAKEQGDRGGIDHEECLKATTSTRNARRECLHVKVRVEETQPAVVPSDKAWHWRRRGCSTSASSTSDNSTSASWPKSKLAQVEIGRSRKWPKSKLIGRNRKDGVCSVPSFSLSFFSFALSFYFSLLFSCSYSSLSSFCFCSVSVFVPKNLNWARNPEPCIPFPMDLSAGPPLRWTPLHRTTPPDNPAPDNPPPDNPPPDRPKFRSFFSLLPPQFSFFSPSLGGPFVEFWWCFWRPGPCNVHVRALRLSCETPAAPPDRAAGARTQQPENSKRAHFRAPALQTPPKFHERTPRERKKKENCGGRREKKARNFGPPTLLGSTLLAPPFWTPPFWAPPFWAPPFGAPSFGAHFF